MSAQTDLYGVYQKWRNWSEVEHQAIDSSDWSLLDACHEAKQRLQKSIIQLTEAAQSEWVDKGLDKNVQEREIRVVVDELIELETRNGRVLADKRESLRSEQAELHDSLKRLRRVQGSYANSRGTAWQSYS